MLCGASHIVLLLLLLLVLLLLLLLCAAAVCVPLRSLLLLEDVDAAFVGRSVEGASSRLTFSGLLNAIDGVGSHPADSTAYS